jgi:acyl-coenzyme A synthetase/AMP-(fatty) acid ligase
MNPVRRIFDFASKNPSAVAISSSAIRITYANLVESVQLFASAFIAAGIKRGQVVAVATKPEFECLATLSLLQIGAISISATESVFKNYNKNIDWLITDGTLPLATKQQIIVNEDFFEKLGKYRPNPDVEDIDESALVRVVFSSGTTGTPKGVPFTLRNLLARIESARNNWIPSLPFMSLLGLDTVTGMQTFFWSVINGETYFAVTSAKENLRQLLEHKVSSLKTSPARLRDLVAVAETNALPELNTIQVAGSLLDNKLVSDCERKFGITPTYLYGSTEVGTVTRGQFRKEEPNNLGATVSDIELEITADSKIRYRKAGMPEGYWLKNNNRETGFIDGWFYPGDLGFLNSSNELLLSGRTDDVVNVGGAKFNLLELDLWLQNSEMFEEVGTFRIPTKDGIDEIGIAFVSRNPPIPDLLTRRVRAFLNELEFRYLFRVPELPRNKLGKVDRNALALLVSNLN